MDQTCCALPTLLHDFARHAADRPGKPFVVAWNDGTYRVLSYADAYAEALRVAGYLIGYTPGSIVYIVLEHTPMLYPVYLGVMLAGLTPSFLPFPTPKQDAALYFSSHGELFERTPPAAIITYPALIGALRDVTRPGTPVLDVDALDAASTEPVMPRPDDVAMLQHSSGTTGLKKGVALTYRQIAAQTTAYAPVAGLTQASVVVTWLPLYHDMGLFTGFLIPLSLGASIVAIDAFEWVRQPSLLLRLIEAFGGTHAWLPNFAFHHIVEATPETERFDLTSLHLIVGCSEPVRPETLRQFEARFGAMGVPAHKLRACYAMAETCFAVSQAAGPEGNPSLIFDRRTTARGMRPTVAIPGPHVPTVELASNGHPIESIDVGIGLGAGITTVETTDVGEILVRGAFVFRHYHNEPDLTEAAHDQGWYRTGDIGFRHAGELFICGRVKELIIVHGRNFYCHDVEAALSGVPGIVPGRVVAIGIDTPDTPGEELLLIAEPDSDDPAMLPQLRRTIKMAVFAHLELMPRQVEFVPRGWLVKTTSGKLSRVENLRRLRERTLVTAI